MYYPYFIAYMGAGFVISILVFFWALNKGQFKDQDRARFLPLEPGPKAEPVRFSRSARIETGIMVVLACSGLAATAVFILWTLSCSE